MKRYCITVEPESAFGTPLKGDTLFGQLCWAILNRHGQEHLEVLLGDYSRRPFAVCSDGFPNAYLPRPSLPVSCFSLPQGEDYKAIKKRLWIPMDTLDAPVPQWLHTAKSDSELPVKPGVSKAQRQNTQKPTWEHYQPQPHNSINRLTGTTGEGMFAPYSQQQIWYWPGSSLNVYLLLDETQLSLQEVRTLLCDIGVFGYGRDASIGLGKFRLTDCVEAEFNAPENANACLTLAPCAPQGMGMDGRHSYYNTVTRFGRHGDVGVHGAHGPFKAPVLLADTGAVFTPVKEGQTRIGQALGGLSKTIPGTVHQGYAPCVPIYLPPKTQQVIT